MSITVVTALYNGAPWIDETISSVEAQTRRPAEHWVIDDNSTDGSREIVRQHPGIRITQNPGKGPNPARAFAINQTRSKYIAVLDQDDVWHPQHLEFLAEALDKNPDAPAAFSGSERFYTGETIPYRANKGAPQPFDPWERFPTCAIAAPAQVLIRRDALIAAGGWPVHITGVADAFMWMRLSVSQPLLALPALTVGYRQHEHSYSKVMRQQQGRKYFERLMAASKEALKTRQLSGNPSEVEQRRLDVFSLMFEWLDALNSTGRKAGEKTITQALDRELTKHPSAQATELWLQVFYFAAPAHTKLRAVQRAWWLLRLYSRAPRNAQSLRRSLRAVIAHNIHLAMQKIG